ncbi:MAG: diaminopimelate decarboxylase [Christensenellaceae bacterium]|nr:diaminopimelate decarboxylase [Christensenellaceae bacterium]
MKIWKNLDINEKGHLCLGGNDTIELAEKYGTPLYVMEEDVIRSVCRSYMQVIREKNISAKIAYASKAFMTTAMCRIIESEGLHLDVVSEGEFRTAMNAGFDTAKIYYHGNNKTEHELETAIKNGVGCIIIDSFHEIDIIDQLAGKYGKKQNVGLRIKPGVDAHTHKYIMTGNEDSKFGFGIEDETADFMLQLICEKENLVLSTLHCHIGSQIFELESFAVTVDIMTDYLKKITEKYGISVQEINFGGGFGIHYTNEDKPLEFSEYVALIAEKLSENCKKKGLGEIGFVVEPGRSIVGEAGTTLYTIGAIKNIPGIRTYVSVDGGMTDNPRTALYQAEYLCTVANKMNEEADTKVSIAGRCCESGDMLIWDTMIQSPAYKDILAVFSTGAYCYSMASNYNKVPHAAVVLVSKGKSALMVKRQSFEQLMENDCIPDWLGE